MMIRVLEERKKRYGAYDVVESMVEKVVHLNWDKVPSFLEACNVNQRDVDEA